NVEEVNKVLEEYSVRYIIIHNYDPKIESYGYKIKYQKANDFKKFIEYINTMEDIQFSFKMIFIDDEITVYKVQKISREFNEA
ncbi:MAG: hypothetical protein QXP78_05850, partial [Candidatus Bathyarchaeia archaeon]